MDGQDRDSRIRVVIADDHAVFREGTRTLLAREPDIEVVGEAADGEAAVQIVQEWQPDVAILDIAMPRLNGIEATRRIKQQSPETRVLVLTAYNNDEYVVAMVAAGAAGYVLKMANYQAVTAAVRSVYECEAVLDPGLARKVWGHFTRQVKGTRAETVGGEALSERELMVLRYAARGLSNREIGLALSMSWLTVQTHLRSIFGKLGVASRTEAVVKGLQEGWLCLEDLQ